MLNGMKHICVGLLVALLSGTALAQSGPSGFSVVTDAVLVPSETVLGDDVKWRRRMRLMSGVDEWC